MGKFLGIDLGTNSIGLSLRNTDKPGKIEEQLDYFSSAIFDAGVGSEKGNEFSYASKRTAYRSKRRLYQSRRYRIWATLDLLIEKNCCPLKMTELEKWYKYDKNSEPHRAYPLNNSAFNSWISLDFNEDGVPDYSSPYQLRDELTKAQFDFSKVIDRYKLGRALYHIAQRRGFKSSKGDTVAEIDTEDENVDLSIELKKSEEKSSSAIRKYMEVNNLKTVGQALAKLEREGVRLRGSIYTPIRQQYLDEVNYIFEFQKGLRDEVDFHKKISSTKKGEGTIFYKRPLRSQTGNIGKCTLEKNKRRCPESHPLYEEFRALSFINNIKIKRLTDSELKFLDNNLRKDLYNDLFIGRAKSNFNFEDIRKWVEKRIGEKLSKEDKTINYKDNVSVTGCPVSYRLKKILGESWKDRIIESDEVRVDKKTGREHKLSYNYIDIWHICFSFDDAEFVENFGRYKLKLDEDSVKDLCRLWGTLSQGYSMLSLKAISKINVFLRKGHIYSNAVFLAKIPEILGYEKWNIYGKLIESQLSDIITLNNKKRITIAIVNSLISKYKALSFTAKFAEKNYDYELTDSDNEAIYNAAIDHYGKNKWNQLDSDIQKSIIEPIKNLYQAFFKDRKRAYLVLPKTETAIIDYIIEKCNVSPEKTKILYHPSQIEIYPEVKPQLVETNGEAMSLRLLGNPDVGIFKNPSVMRTLRILRNLINSMLENRLIDEDTKIVVEMAREMNDANMRWAIETYQDIKERENAEFKAIISEIYQGYTLSDSELENAIEKVKLVFEQMENCDNTKKSKDNFLSFKGEKELLIKKYKLWREQNFRCLYTGATISLTSLFDGNKWDIEHTIPRSRGMDNSMANLTICSSEFNRKIKKNCIPSELPNHSEILMRIKPWIDRLKQIDKNIKFNIAKAKSASTKDKKDSYIRQRHLWELEYIYWKKKVETFTITSDKVNEDFRNSQLVDTRIITKYALHYLRSAFNSVEVVPGSITAEIRRLVGVQKEDEKKSRLYHSHHAIDATMLILITSKAQRNKMLNLFYKKEEAKKYGDNESYVLNELEDLKEQNGLNNVSGIKKYIEDNILINYISKDQTLTPARKTFKARNKKGEKVVMYATGDSMRCSLHKDTFYGMIRKGEDYNIVINQRIDSLNKATEKDIDKFIESVVDEGIKNRLRDVINKRLTEGMKIDEAIKNIWLLDSEGKEIREDKNGRKLAPMRHIRCYAPGGKGRLTKNGVLTLKEQTYPSKFEYKNSYYVQNDGNYLCLFFENRDRNDVQSRIVQFMELAMIRNKYNEDITDESVYQRYFGEPGYSLKYVIKVGTKVLIYKESPDELSPDNYADRLYIIYKFNQDHTSNNIYLCLKHNLLANINNIKALSTFEDKNSTPVLRWNAKKCNMLVEGYDFYIDNLGRISFPK